MDVSGSFCDLEHCCKRPEVEFSAPNFGPLGKIENSELFDFGKIVEVHSFIGMVCEKPMGLCRQSIINPLDPKQGPRDQDQGERNNFLKNGSSSGGGFETRI